METNYEKLKDINIKNIILPGTHDTGAYKIDFSTHLENKTINFASDTAKILPCVGHIIKNWTITQDDSLYHQLKRGIRCFDLRLSSKSDIQEYYITHSFVLLTLVDGLQQIKRFLDETTKEIVVVTVSSDWVNRDFYDGTNIINVIETVMGKNLIATEFKTLEQMLADGERVIFLQGANVPWIDTDSTDVKYNFLVREYDKFQSYGYNILSFTLTPNKKTVFKGILMPWTNIKTMDKGIHKKYYEFNKYFIKPINTSCIMFNFPDDNIINSVIKMNFVQF